ncbi:MAG: hypothetical protein AB1568_16860 [Thermodesulfobacteriota bacterium]
MEGLSTDKRRQALTFGLAFLVLSGAIFFLLGTRANGFFESTNFLTADILARTLRAAGRRAVARGELVSAEGFSVRVIAECSAVYLLALYFCFVLAYPAPGRAKGFGLLFGLPLIWAANQLRLFLIFLVGLADREIFETAHIYFGQIFMIGVTFLLCMGWLQTMVAGRRPRPALLFLLRFLAVASPLFLLWLYLDDWYLAALDHGARLLGAMLLGLPYDTGAPANLQQYQTFNIVAYAALVLAMPSRGRATGIRALPIGLALLTATHLIMRFCYFAVTYGNLPSVFFLWVGVNMFNQYLYPVVLWLIISGNSGENAGITPEQRS